MRILIIDNYDSFVFNIVQLIKETAYKPLFDVVKNNAIPFDMLNREKNKIQKETIISGKPYMNEKKIKDGIKQITYPLYHLDFETFPCPLPRYKGERPYTQSVFQFSLHNIPVHPTSITVLRF